MYEVTEQTHALWCVAQLSFALLGVQIHDVVYQLMNRIGQYLMIESVPCLLVTIFDGLDYR